MATSILRFTNIIFAALLAVTSFGIWVGLNPKNYSPSTYLEQHQNLVLYFNTLMVSLVILATLVTLASAFLQRKNKPVFRMLLIAAASFAACILIFRFGNLPIQKEMLTWNADSLPGNWTMLRDKWWSLHLLWTIMELVALALVSWTSVQRQ